MNKKLKTKWITALRSGKFRQGPGYLHTEANRDVKTSLGEDYPETYCCLGVLCEVSPNFREEYGDFFATGKTWARAAAMRAINRPSNTPVKDLDEWEREEFDHYLDLYQTEGVGLDGEEIPEWLEPFLGLDIKVRDRSKGKNQMITLQSKLIQMNDDGVPFDKIADYIEKHLPTG